MKKGRREQDRAAKQPAAERRIAKRIAELEKGSADDALRKALEIEKDFKNRKGRENP